MRFCVWSQILPFSGTLYDVLSSGHNVCAFVLVSVYVPLRLIALHSAGRAIYSNVNGFLGGVAWAMSVARVCQLYPNAIAGAIVSRFFVIMYRWYVFVSFRRKRRIMI